MTDALGYLTKYTYDELGERTSQTDANLRVTAFAYDQRGRQVQRKLPGNAVETITYDHAGEKTSRTDFSGILTSYGYDLLGRLLSRSYPAASAQNVSFTYTPDGLRATAVDARGTTSYAYDNRRRMASMTYPSGNQLSYAYDARGLRTGTTSLIGSRTIATTTAYDADGRPATVTDPIGRAYPVGYDVASNRTQLGYPNAATTTYQYDPNNRLTNLTTLQGTGASPATVQSFAYTLDDEGKRTGVVESSGATRQYGYDSVDRLTSEIVTGSLAYAKTFTYDPVGNRHSQSTTGSGAAAVTYTYDVRDRLTSDGTSYAYDGNGNETTKTNEALYAYDLENRLTQVNAEQHTYDADGNRVKTAVAVPTTCSASGATFVRNDATTQGNWIGTYGGDGYAIEGTPASPPHYGNVTVSGATVTWAATSTDVRVLQDPPPGTSRIASAWYGGAAVTVKVTTTDNSPHTVALYLLDWDPAGRTESVTAMTTGGTVLDSRSFTAIQSGAYAVYTVCGSVNFNVTTLSGPNAVVSGVFFGAPPQATATNYLVDTSGGLSEVVADMDGSNNLTATYVRVGNELLAVMRPNGSGWTTRFVHADGLGSVRTLTDETGAVVDTRSYEAFGTKNSEAGSDPLPYGFAGEAFDATTGLSYNRARWMDSRVGRFTGMDPKTACKRDPMCRACQELCVTCARPALLDEGVTHECDRTENQT